MVRIGVSAVFFLSILTLCLPGRGQTAPSPDAAPTTEPIANLLGPAFTSHVHGIQFQPPANSVQSDKAAPDSIAEFDRDDYDWQLKVWSTRLEKPLPLSIHKDQFGSEQDGVMEITLANIKQQTPSAQVLRDEVINVGRVRVGMISVRYDTANHDRRFTQQAIVEAPDADHKLYYFLDLTGPGKPPLEPDEVVNPAEKLAFDTFGAVVDSVQLLDRKDLVSFQYESVTSTRALFVLWGADNFSLVKSGITPDQFRRIVSDGQDIGYQHVVEEFDQNGKDLAASILKIGVRTRMSPTALRSWDTETWMFSSSDRKHEHWKTAAQCTDARGKMLDSFSQVGISDEQTKAFAIEPKESPDGSLLPQQDYHGRNGPLEQGNVDIEIRRSLEVTTTHRRAQLNPFRLDVPSFYVPQAYSYILPEILPLKPKKYMFAVFVPNTPENTSSASSGNVMARYVEVLPIDHVKFHGEEFDAIPVTDKIGLDGPVTTIYRSLDGKFLGSTVTLTQDGKSTTVEILPTDSQTLGHIWNRPDLAAPNEPAANGDTVLPAPTGQ